MKYYLLFILNIVGFFSVFSQNLKPYSSEEVVIVYYGDIDNYVSRFKLKINQQNSEKNHYIYKFGFYKNDRIELIYNEFLYFDQKLKVNPLLFFKVN